MKPGSVIINTSSIAAYRPYGIAVDYETTKGAIVSFTRSLSKNLLLYVFIQSCQVILEK
jgi:NAD(P)-dependent dehydrogenase (short-subunit alcohol dehydrogenase family)